MGVYLAANIVSRSEIRKKHGTPLYKDNQGPLTLQNEVL
jgi:hypothetical protein